MDQLIWGKPLAFGHVMIPSSTSWCLRKCGILFLFIAALKWKFSCQPWEYVQVLNATTVPDTLISGKRNCVFYITGHMTTVGAQSPFASTISQSQIWLFGKSGWEGLAARRQMERRGGNQGRIVYCAQNTLWMGHLVLSTPFPGLN